MDALCSLELGQTLDVGRYLLAHIFHALETLSLCFPSRSLSCLQCNLDNSV